MERAETKNRKEAGMKNIYINVYKDIKTGRIDTSSHHDSFDDCIDNVRENDRNEWEYLYTMLPSQKIITSECIDDYRQRCADEKRDLESLQRVMRML